MLSFIVLFILSAFRTINVGTDTVNYEVFFNFTKYASGFQLSEHRIEPGWVFLNSFISGLNGDYRILLVVVSLMTLMPIFYTAKKISSNPMLSITLYYLLYFYFYSLNIARQMLAVSIVVLAINLLLKNKKISFVSLVLFASLFHTTALLAFIFLLFNYIPNRKSSLSLYTLLSIGFGLIGYTLIIKLVTISSYSHLLDYFVPRSLKLSSLLLFIFNFIFFIILYTIKKDVLNTIEFKLYLIFVLLFNITIRVPLSSRLLLYFSIIQIIFYPFYLKNINRYNIKYKPIFAILIIFYAYSIFLRSIILGEGEVLPYQNLLF